MILSVTLNPSVDMDFIVNGLHAGGRYRTSVSRRSPGGSGINVSIILSRLGHPSVATGFLAGFNAYYVLEALRKEGITTNFIHTRGETRINVCITDTAGDTETRLHEAGLHVSQRDVKAFLRNYDRILGRVDRVIIGGSLPPSADVALYAELARKARDNSVPVAVSSRPEDMEGVLAEFPTIVKYDAAAFTGDEGTRLQTLLARAAELHRHGTQWVLAPTSAETIVFSTPQGAWTAQGSAIEMKFFYAAGDALLAGLLAALEEDLPSEEAIRLSAACYWECTTHPEKFPENRQALAHYLPQFTVAKID